MNLVSRVGLSLTLVAAALFGCAGQDSEDTGSGAGAATSGSACAANVDINFQDIHKVKDAPASSIDPYNPDFKTCETNIQIIQVTGTRYDAQINKLLGSDLIAADPPCESPETNDGSVTLKFLANGILSTAGPGSWYGAGAAHPSFGIEYKNIDLTKGKEITLDQIVTEEARATIVRSLKAQIGAQRQPAYLEDGTPARTAAGKQKMDPLDADTKRSLLFAVDAEFGADQHLADIRDFTISAKGIRFDLVNQLPHGLQGTEATYLVRFDTLNGKIAANSPVQRLISSH